MAERGIISRLGFAVLLQFVAGWWFVAQAQPAAGDSLTIAWRQVVDGEAERFPELPATSLARPDDAVDALLDWYRRQGFYEASVDSFSVDTATAAATTAAPTAAAAADPDRREGVVWVRPGRRVTVGEVIVTGASVYRPEQLMADFETRPGRVLDPVILERDLGRLLDLYDRRGYVLASTQIVRISPAEDDPSLLEIAIHVEEGPLLQLAAIEVVGGRRTTPTFISHVTGMRVGEPMRDFDPEKIRANLDATGLFTSVDSVRLGIDENKEAVLSVALKEGPPGSFDALVGYLPNAGASGGGSVVGDVNILLKHVLGGGRAFGFRFRRNPGSVTQVNLHADDPYIFGLPFRLAGRFDGLQQDSTYDTRSYGIEGGYRIDRLELFANATRELTRPGSARSSTVPSSDSWFAGVGFSFRSVDLPASPRRGVLVESRFENGRKERQVMRPTTSGGSERVLETVYQQRLSGSARLFVPVQRRSVFVAGVDSRAIQSRTYDQADLVRFGGANSMRGYNEDQFRGNLTLRALTEWRYLFERASFLFVFADFGYVNIPEVNTVNPAERVASDWLAGFGAGLQLQTEAGLFTISLAFNGDEGLDAKIHVGMTLGL